jgi:hypothetical protein
MYRGRKTRLKALVTALLVALAAAGTALAQAPAPAQPPSSAPAQPVATPPAQQEAAPAPAKARREPAEPIVDDSFSIRQDEELYQLDEAVSLIAGSLNRVSDRVSNLAINSFYFGKEVSADFRRKAEVIILDKLFAANSQVSLVQCQECQKMETKIVHGVLHLRKGIPSRDARIELAKKLSVDGFIDIGMFKDNGQLTVYLKVIEAETGAIILVEELVGRRAPRRTSFTVAVGDLFIPIEISKKPYMHSTLTLTVTEAIQLTQRFSFGVDVSFFTDNNTNNPDPHLTVDDGVLIAPTLSYDILQVLSSATRVQMYLGVGKLIAPQFNYGDFLRAGIQSVVGDRLVVVLGANDFGSNVIKVGSTDLAREPLLKGGAILNGVGYELRFGYRF